MAKCTEDEIMDALEETLKEKPFEKIRVRDIITKCGVSRNTFYYHNNDLYDLLDKTLKRQQERLLEDVDSETFNWKDGFTSATKWLTKNKETVKNVYGSRDLTMLEKYISASIRTYVEEFVNDQAEGLNVSISVVKDTITVISAAIEGLIIDWVRDGMKSDLVPFAERVTDVLQGAPRKILEQYAK